MTFTAGAEFHAELVDGVYVAADELGYDVVLSAVTPHRDEARALRTLVDDRCEALVMIGSIYLPATWRRWPSRPRWSWWPGECAEWMRYAATTPQVRLWAWST